MKQPNEYAVPLIGPCRAFGPILQKDLGCAGGGTRRKGADQDGGCAPETNVATCDPLKRRTRWSQAQGMGPFIALPLRQTGHTLSGQFSVCSARPHEEVYGDSKKGEKATGRQRWNEILRTHHRCAPVVGDESEHSEMGYGSSVKGRMDTPIRVPSPKHSPCRKAWRKVR